MYTNNMAMVTISSLYGASEMRHSKSEDLLGAGSRSQSPNNGFPTTTSEDDLIATTALHDFHPHRLLPPRVVAADRIDPEDSIRDIVTENDLYRFVLFKKHYDKYMALAAKYEEAKGIAYYLEERYHEVKAEKDKMETTREAVEQRLEGCENELRSKEDELFLQFERSLRLEEELERGKVERDNCIATRNHLERECETTLRRLQMQLTQNEITRRNLERARQEAIGHATIIRAERDAFERENEILRGQLQAKQEELGIERQRREEGVAALTRETLTLRHAARHLRAATLHATSCRRRRRCSICLYAKRTFAEIDEYRNDGKIFNCLQAPLQDLRSWFRTNPPAVTASTSCPQRISSPLNVRNPVGCIDNSSVNSSSSSSSGGGCRAVSRSSTSSSSSNSTSDDEAYPSTPVAEMSLSSTNSSTVPNVRAFSSDSGFSSEVGDRRSRSYEVGAAAGINERKLSDTFSSLDDQKTPNRVFNRSKWTSSFRKLLGRKSKV